MAAGLSQQELAALLQLKNQTSISQMERGVQLVDIAQAEQMADLLKVSPSWLAFGESKNQDLEKRASQTE